MLHGADAPDFTVLGVAGLGALTTFSTLAQELVDLWPENPRRSVGYGVITMIGGTGAAFLRILAA